MTYTIQKIISNGIPFYFLDLKGTGTFSYNIIQNKGSSIERALHKINDYNGRPKSPLYGISHLIEHMSFKNTKDYTTEQMSRLLKEKGYHNAFTSYDKVVYFLKSISDYTDDVIKMVNNIAFNDMTKITDKEFETEKDIVISEANLVYENPQQIFHYNAGCKAFGMDTFDNVIGNPVTLKTLKHSDLIDVKKEVMRKNNLTIKVIFDSDKSSPEQIIDKINKSMSEFKIEDGSPVLDTAYKRLMPDLEFRKQHVVDKLSSYPQLLLNQYFDIPESYHLLLSDWVVDYLNYYASTGLFEYIREKDGLCYSINIYSGVDFGKNSYRISTEIPKDKLTTYQLALNKSLKDTLEDFDEANYQRYYNIHRMNEKINMLNLNSMGAILDKLIEHDDIFDKYEDLLKTKGVMAYTETLQKDLLTQKNMKDILSIIKSNINDDETILITN